MKRLYDVYLVIRDYHGNLAQKRWQANFSILKTAFWFINHPKSQERKRLFTDAQFVASWEIKERED